MTSDLTGAKIQDGFRVPDRQRMLVATLALGLVALYVMIGFMASQPGFPLDDAWIHQTYARNLIRSGRWEYVAGQTSAGSTAPLWTLLLAVGYASGLPPVAWAVMWGAILLVWASWSTMALWQSLWPQWADKAWVAGAFVATTWSLVWSAGSGMETILFISLALQSMVIYSRQYQSGHWRPALLGFLAGLLILTRPEGLGLLLLFTLGLIIGAGSLGSGVRHAALFLLAAGLGLVPYFAFNYLSGGHLWPNTFYAKQAEYAALWQEVLPVRFVRLLIFSLGGPEYGWRGISGAHLLLLPGLVVAGWRALKSDFSRRTLLHSLPLLWALGHILSYAWRLPVTYHHGRYLWPSLPVWILYGLAGWQTISAAVLARIGHDERFRFLWLGTTRISVGVLLAVFLLLGLQVFQLDLAFINGEMVDVAHWLQENTESDSLIAAHDIGAIGFFAQRPLLDLAGLISPEVIPMLSDEQALTQHILSSGADYLVTAPGWTYDRLTQSDMSRPVYSTDFAWTVGQEMNNMEVYQLLR